MSTDEPDRTPITDRLDELQGEALGVLVDCLDRVRVLLDEAAGTDDELKTIGRATSTASRLLSELQSARKHALAEADDKGASVAPVDPEVAADIEARVSRIRLDDQPEP